MIAFPELAICGYPPEDLLLRPTFLAACEREVAALAHDAHDIALYLGHPHAQGEVYNAASLLRDGAIEVTYHKQALPNYTVFDEKRYFRSGHEAAVVEISGVRVGLLICEDIWEAEPAARAARAGAEMLMIINASPYDIPQAKTREELLAHRARENDVAIAYVNVVGGQDDLLFDGGALLVEPDGRIAARAPQFVDALLIAEYDAAAQRFFARDWPEADDDSMEAVRLRGARARHPRLCRQERFSGRVARSFRRRRFGVDARARGRRARRRARHRGHDAEPLHVRSLAARGRARRRSGSASTITYCRSSRPSKPFARRWRRCSPAVPKTSPKKTCKRAAAACC